MDMEIRYACGEEDWKTVSQTLERVGMAFHDPGVHEKAFAASHTTVFVYRDGRLIGFGRAISDGVYQAAVYDVAVAPEYQGRGVGRTIIGKILERVPGCTVILYAAPGREDFYRKLGFRRMKTGMALFSHAERMAEKGFTE